MICSDFCVMVMNFLDNYSPTSVSICKYRSFKANCTESSVLHFKGIINVVLNRAEFEIWYISTLVPPLPINFKTTNIRLVISTIATVKMQFVNFRSFYLKPKHFHYTTTFIHISLYIGIHCIDLSSINLSSGWSFDGTVNVRFGKAGVIIFLVHKKCNFPKEWNAQQKRIL